MRNKLRDLLDRILSWALADDIDNPPMKRKKRQ